MINPFSFKGRIGTFAYALWALPIFLSQYAIVLLVARLQNKDIWAEQYESVVFFVHPFRALVSPYGNINSITALLSFAYMLVVAWALAALSYRRALGSNFTSWSALGAVVPGLQMFVITVLIIVPPLLSWAWSTEPEQGPADSGWRPALQGTLAGTGLTLAAVALGALVFGVYGYGMFLVTPILIGAISAYVANRNGDIGPNRTMRIVSGAALAGSVALILGALEGVVCILMALPLSVACAVFGGLFGREIALSRLQSPKHAASSIAILPLVFALEAALPASTTFETSQTIEVNAPSEVVWKSIVRMDMSDEPLGLPFRLGVAYPIRGEILGEGVGATRRGEFSTGVAIERVTEWEPNRKLAFVVEQDVPAMKEMSPYGDIHTPHVQGFFRTALTSFELTPLPDGRTQVVERTSHELKLDPVLYWLPMARWIVDENNARMLAYVKRHAERSAAKGQ